MPVLRKVLCSVVLSALLVPASANAARRNHRCHYEECGNYGGGNGNEGSEGDQNGRDDCHSFCNNVIVIPNPMQPGK
jgi:hypothetical protein